MYISKTVAANSCFKNLNPKHNESTEKLKYETGRFSRDAETKTCRETAPKQAGLAPAGLRQLSPSRSAAGSGWSRADGHGSLPSGYGPGMVCGKQRTRVARAS